MSYGRTARALVMRPPLAYGGHCFVLICDGGDHERDVLWCAGCQQACPTWAAQEGFATTLLGRWCVGMFKMLEPAP